MPESNQLSRYWKIGWVLLLVSSAIISSRMAYMAPIILAISYPVAQMISISFVPNARYFILWLVHILYWIVVISVGITENVIFVGMLGSSILGEVLLRIIVENIVKWRWLLYNTCAMTFLIVCYKFASFLDKPYQFSPILVVAIMFGLSSLVSAQGIKLKTKKAITRKQ